MNVEVVFLPPIATELPSKLCIVIDVLRATSTLVSMFESGVRRVTLAGSIQDALAQVGTAPGRPFVCGESGGLPPAGFDYGNSPREFRPEVMEGKDLVFFTSNGTRAMRHLSAAPVVLAGSLLNATTVVRAALREAMEMELDIAVVCSGDHLGTRFAIDDAFTAGYLCSLMEREGPAFLDGAVAGPVDGDEEDVSLDESAEAAVRLYRSFLGDAGASDDVAVPPQEAILRAFWRSHNARVLKKVGLSEDVLYCAQVDISAVVPRLRVEGDALVLYPEM
ncbi:MAG: 2-phosphosulfolactate phosphatase [Actinobacteria bacterium]|nr:2-phosphosulfolactate phosphatase [Actinomycetota bacterium]